MNMHVVPEGRPQRPQRLDLHVVDTISEKVLRDAAEMSIRVYIYRSLMLDLFIGKWGALVLCVAMLIVSTFFSFRVALRFDDHLGYVLLSLCAAIVCFGIWLLLENIAEDLELTP